MNVLVVAAHGLGCHWLGPYGNAWVATPAFDALACESILFDRHFADDPSPAGLRLACPTALVELLRHSGITPAFVDDRKDRTPDDRIWLLTVPSDPAKSETPGQALAVAVCSALDQLAGHSPWFLWIETDRLVPPWDLELETYQQYAATSGGFAADEEGGQESEELEPTDSPTPGPFDSDDDREWHRLHNSFAAAVTTFDAELATLAAAFRERGLDDSTTWVVTSGYGWPLGEHGVVGPSGSRMYEELVHLPLLLRLPGHRQGMRRVSAFTQASDLTPTICDLFGLPAGSSSLLPLTVGQATAWRDVARSTMGPERAIRTTDWAYLAAVPESGRPARLYHKPDDIWEVNDLARRYPDECDRLADLESNR
jgi:arylsulfatase A-like enzyme